MGSKGDRDSKVFHVFRFVNSIYTKLISSIFNVNTHPLVYQIISVENCFLPNFPQTYLFISTITPNCLEALHRSAHRGKVIKICCLFNYPRPYPQQTNHPRQHPRKFPRNWTVFPLLSSFGTVSPAQRLNSTLALWLGRLNRAACPSIINWVWIYPPSSSSGKRLLPSTSLCKFILPRYLYLNSSWETLGENYTLSSTGKSVRRASWFTCFSSY